MRIVPKIAADIPTVPESIIPYLHDRVEFHLNGYTAVEFGNMRTIIQEHALKDVVIHAPFGRHDLDVVCLSQKLYEEASICASIFSDWAAEFGIRITLLFHTSMSVEALKQLPVVERFNKLIQETSINYLLENSFADPSTGIRRLKEDPILYILERVPEERVSMCFDLCHHMASSYILHEEYKFQEEWAKHITQIHFSDTKNYEGYIHFHTTHGRVHDNVWEVARDLCQMESYGIDLGKAHIVVEVSEVDYHTRSDQAQELSYLHRLNDAGGIVFKE